MVAHTLARAICSWASHHIFNSYPSSIENWLINDNSYIFNTNYKDLYKFSIHLNYPSNCKYPFFIFKNLK